MSTIQSETINELAEALSKAQGQITGALKDSSNPFFKSKYADLASCWDACRQQLAANGLSVIQTTAVCDGVLCLLTTLAHKSGQWVRGALPIKAKDDGAQAQGSGLTYARRYALAAIVGLAQIDDDAEAAQGRNQNGHDPRPDTSSVPAHQIAETVRQIRAVLDKDIDSDAMCLEIFDIHHVLTRNEELYVAVADALTAQKVISKADWKSSVKRGKELAMRPAA